jgi:hypothetical protein
MNDTLKPLTEAQGKKEDLSQRHRGTEIKGDWKIKLFFLLLFINENKKTM